MTSAELIKALRARGASPSGVLEGATGSGGHPQPEERSLFRILKRICPSVLSNPFVKWQAFSLSLPEVDDVFFRWCGITRN